MKNNCYKNLQRQHDQFKNFAGSEVLSNNSWNYINNRLITLHTIVKENPIAELKLAELERQRAIINLQDYEEMIKKTYEAVKQEAKAAVEEAIEEITKEFK